MRRILVTIHKMYRSAMHFIGKITKKYYIEDYRRVYPDGIVFYPLAFRIRRKATEKSIKSFLNHLKFYKFAAQFAKRKRVADVGCGSGYGCEILKKSGATLVCGSDVSKESIRFAQSRYNDFAEFTIQNITNLNKYPDNFFDVVVSNEVLEHVKEYNMEEKAINELKRITRKGGLLVIGTPNSEMLEEHGFSFDEINRLFEKKFSKFIIFENALVPFGNANLLWEKRLSKGRTGIIVSEHINLSETIIPDGMTPKIKSGVKTEKLKFGSYTIDTRLLHNTHSWIILAIKNR